MIDYLTLEWDLMWRSWNAEVFGPRFSRTMRPPRCDEANRVPRVISWPLMPDEPLDMAPSVVFTPSVLFELFGPKFCWGGWAVMLNLRVAVSKSAYADFLIDRF